eukprot:TRINITY_DN15735_c0_g1_i1.p1 TRINITY_DN15735_c0_g1~~TRINITY_DN15735_c0_g1_i1.p1  ORF type:complete len:570 (+),score=73.59 TRINITY_DN15735_c0_g1_i1:76-1785(+)
MVLRLRSVLALTASLVRRAANASRKHIPTTFPFSIRNFPYGERAIEISTSPLEDVQFRPLATIRSKLASGPVTPVFLWKLCSTRMSFLQPYHFFIPPQNADFHCSITERLEKLDTKAVCALPFGGLLASFHVSPLHLPGALTATGSMYLRKFGMLQDTSRVMLSDCVQLGAFPFANTTCPELCVKADTDAIAHNAHNPDYSSGGSSGGAAASIAAGIGHFSIASDASGSVRLAAALNGVVGFKAPRGWEEYPRWNSHQSGAITRSVADLTFVLEQLQPQDVLGTKPAAISLANVMSREYFFKLPHRKVALTLTCGVPSECVDPVVCSAVREAAGHLERNGVQIDILDDTVEGRELLRDLYHPQIRDVQCQMWHTHLTEQVSALKRDFMNMLMMEKELLLAPYVGEDRLRASAEIDSLRNQFPDFDPAAPEALFIAMIDNALLKRHAEMEQLYDLARERCDNIQLDAIRRNIIAGCEAVLTKYDYLITSAISCTRANSCFRSIGPVTQRSQFLLDLITTIFLLVLRLYQEVKAMTQHRSMVCCGSDGICLLMLRQCVQCILGCRSQTLVF